MGCYIYGSYSYSRYVLDNILIMVLNTQKNQFLIEYESMRFQLHNCYKCKVC